MPEPDVRITTAALDMPPLVCVTGEPPRIPGFIEADVEMPVELRPHAFTKWPDLTPEQQALAMEWQRNREAAAWWRGELETDEPLQMEEVDVDTLPVTEPEEEPEPFVPTHEGHRPNCRIG